MIWPPANVVAVQVFVGGLLGLKLLPRGSAFCGSGLFASRRFTRSLKGPVASQAVGRRKGEDRLSFRLR